MLNWLVLISTLNLIGVFYLGFIIYLRFNRKKNDNVQAIGQIKASKINLVRFNPFDDVGGDQSFILCLLDNTSSGVIITSLHTRDSTRIYAKSIKNGESQSQALSKEETKTLIKTINS